MEVNSTFYAVPGIAQPPAAGPRLTPPGFTFDVKLHRLLSRHSAGLDSLPAPLREQAQTTGRGRVRLDERLREAVAVATLDALAPLIEAGKPATFLLQLSPAVGPRDHALGRAKSPRSGASKHQLNEATGT